jgi:molybdopterin-containing oxidoreductase family iron-sulfur binding subunit
MMDMHRCIGCRYCMAACPYGSRSFNWYDPRDYPIQGAGPIQGEGSELLPEDPDRTKDYPTRSKGVVEKCTFCAEKIRAAGKDEKPVPACVKAANEAQAGAMTFGKLDDEQIQQILEENHTICRRVSLGTGPNVCYIV